MTSAYHPSNPVFVLLKAEIAKEEAVTAVNLQAQQAIPDEELEALKVS